VSWFTGEAVQGDEFEDIGDDDEEDDENDEDDEDEDDDDDEEDDDEEEEGKYTYHQDFHLSCTISVLNLKIR